MSISSSAVLVRQSISTWTANKLDKRQTNQVLANNNATGNAAQVRKNLMVGTRAAKDIFDYAGACRLSHHTFTLPWEDRGSRLLPTSLVMQYKQDANFRRQKFDLMVDKFIAHYPEHIQTSRNYLGGLFNSDDYPCIDELRSKYEYRLVWTPIADSGHFYLDIPARDLDEMKQSLTVENDERLKNAMGSAWDRLHKTLTTMSEKLVEPEGEDKKRWHDTFVTNAHDLCKILSHLNVTGDPELERARKSLETAMVGVDIEDLKGSPLARMQTKSKVDSILSQFDW